MDFVGPTEVIKVFVRPVNKTLHYYIKFNKYVIDFKQAQNYLLQRKEDIEYELQGQLRYVGKRPTMEVESWLKKVEDMISYGQHVEDKVSDGKYLSRYYLGKLLDKTTRAMKELCEEGRLFGSLVVHAPSTVAVPLPTTEIVGQTSVIEEIYNYLMGQDVGMIGVYGEGGIGKTTVTKHVHNVLLRETKFKKIIWTTVSTDLDIRKLQNDIACQLKNNLSDHENTTVRAATLSEILRATGSYVIILDDVCQSFSLEDVGILQPTAHNGCKVVLTTCSENVVRAMGCKKVQVAPLSMKEGFQLLLSRVGEDVLGCPTIVSIMKLIVKECRGLPLPIVEVAGEMRGIHDRVKWRNALNQLRSKRSDVEDMENDVHGMLESRYNNLAETDKYCFLHCALYPEDYEIQEEEIIEYWIEEGLVGEMETREAMKSQGNVYLQRLLKNGLLLGTNSKNIVKMDDVIMRATAFPLIKRNHMFFVEAGMELKELTHELQKAEDLEKVSLMKSSISKLPPDMFPKSEKLTTLLLSGNSFEEIPESFFSHMHGLKYLDLSRNPIKSLPNSISNLENLIALLLCECENLEEVPSLSKLRALKKLHLEKTRIREVPQGMELLENLRYLNLRFILSLKEIPSGILPKLQCLQHLAIHPTLSRAEEIRELKKLETFEGRFVDAHDSSLHNQSQRLSKYFILVDKTLHSCNKFVSFKGTEGTIILPSDVQQLGIEKCNDLTSLNGVSGLKETTRLKKCRIEECEGIESVFSSWCSPLESLESLVLRHLKNLNVLVAYPEPCPGAFSSLKVLFLVKCPKIKILLSTKLVLLQHLINLEQIIVWGCDQMEEIIASEEEGTVSSTITFPKLRELGLWHLPELKSICSTKA